MASPWVVWSLRSLQPHPHPIPPVLQAARMKLVSHSYVGMERCNPNMSHESSVFFDMCLIPIPFSLLHRQNVTYESFWIAFLTRSLMCWVLRKIDL